MEKGKNVRAVFDRFAGLVNAVEKVCKDAGKKLMIHEKYGCVLSCPSNMGTGLRASMMIKIPLSSKQPEFNKWCADRKLQARGSMGFASTAKDDGIRDVSNVDRMGKDEVTLVNEMITGILDLIEWEKKLEKEEGGGHGVSGFNDTTTVGPNEPHAPNYFKSFDDFGQDLANFKGELGLKDILTREMYDSLKDKKTKLGITLDKCIKGGVDRVQKKDWNSGKVGVMLGDEECVDMFNEIVHPCIVIRHGNPNLPHPPPNLDGSQLLDHDKIDDNYVISTRVRTGRSISGFAMPPSISHNQRVELEGIVVKALISLEGDLKGD